MQLLDLQRSFIYQCVYYNLTQFTTLQTHYIKIFYELFLSLFLLKGRMNFNITKSCKSENISLSISSAALTETDGRVFTHQHQVTHAIKSCQKRDENDHVHWGVYFDKSENWKTRCCWLIAGQSPSRASRLRCLCPAPGRSSSCWYWQSPCLHNAQWGIWHRPSPWTPGPLSPQTHSPPDSSLDPGKTHRHTIHLVIKQDKMDVS